MGAWGWGNVLVFNATAPVSVLRPALSPRSSGLTTGDSPNYHDLQSSCILLLITLSHGKINSDFNSLPAYLKGRYLLVMRVPVQGNLVAV